MSGTYRADFQFISPKSTWIALVFGVAVLIMVSVYNITIPETSIVTDSCKIMVLPCSALSGLWWVVIVGLMVGVLNPVSDFRYAGTILQIIAGVWYAARYKQLFSKIKLFKMRLTGRVDIVPVHYFSFLLPPAISLTHNSLYRCLALI